MDGESSTDSDDSGSEMGNERRPYTVHDRQEYQYNDVIHYKQFRMSIKQADVLFAQIEPHLNAPHRQIELTKRQQFDITIM